MILLKYFLYLILGCFLPYLVQFRKNIKKKENIYTKYFIEYNKIAFYTLNILTDFIFAVIAFFIVYEFSIPEKISPFSIICIGLNGRGVVNNFIAKANNNLDDKVE